MSNLAILYRYRDLLFLWISRDFQVRYKQSLLGIGWAVVQPLALTFIFTIVFSRFVKIDTGGVPYPIFTFAALVPWTFFSTSLSLGIPSLIVNMNLVTKVYFPREILPLASIGGAFVDFLCAFVVFLGMLVVYHIPASLHMFWLIPLLIVQIALNRCRHSARRSCYHFLSRCALCRSVTGATLDVCITSRLSSRDGASAVARSILPEPNGGDHRWLPSRLGAGPAPTPVGPGVGRRGILHITPH